MNGQFLSYYYFFYSSFLSIFPQLKNAIEDDSMSNDEIDKLVKTITPFVLARIRSADPMDMGMNDGGYLLVWTLKSLKDKSLEKYVSELWDILLKHKKESYDLLLEMKNSITDSENQEWIDKAISINGLPPKRYQLSKINKNNELGVQKDEIVLKMEKWHKRLMEEYRSNPTRRSEIEKLWEDYLLLKSNSLTIIQNSLKDFEETGSTPELDMTVSTLKNIEDIFAKSLGVEEELLDYRTRMDNEF